MLLIICTPDLKCVPYINLSESPLCSAGNRAAILVGPSGVYETKLDDVGGELLKENVLDDKKEYVLCKI